MSYYKKLDMNKFSNLKAGQNLTLETKSLINIKYAAQALRNSQYGGYLIFTSGDLFIQVTPSVDLESKPTTDSIIVEVVSHAYVDYKENTEELKDYGFNYNDDSKMWEGFFDIDMLEADDVELIFSDMFSDLFNKTIPPLSIEIVLFDESYFESDENWTIH